MKSWLARTFGRSEAKKDADPVETADLWCSFCGKHRREVRKLVAGPNVYICDGCIALCVHIVDEEEPTGAYYASLILDHLADAPRQTRHAVVTQRLRGAIELAAGMPSLLRRIVGVAARYEDRDTALAALAAIPADQRTTVDRLNAAGLLSDSERYAEALAALDAIDAATLTGVDVLLHRLHRAYAELERGGVSREQLAVHRTTALALEPAARALPAGAFEDAVRGERLAVLALALLGLGELAEAEAAARERIERQPDNPSARELLARVLDARGEPLGAAAARVEAVERAHPDGLLARKLRAPAAAGPFR